MDSYPTNKVVGLVLDLSLRHAADGRRIIDYVKGGMCAYFKAHYDDDDAMYLYHFDILESMHKIGAMLSAISNYETDGWQYDVGHALKQTLFVLEAECQHSRLIYITDKMKDIAPIKKVLTLAAKDNIDCELVTVGIGPFYDKEAMRSAGVCHIHIDDPADLYKELTYVQGT
jgi:hypothetical protein